MISYRLWQKRFGGNPGIVGRVVDFDRQPATIVGVLTKDFEFPMPGLPFGGGHDVWVPLGLTQQDLALVGDHNFVVVARLKPGVTIAQAQADAKATARRIYEGIPAPNEWWVSPSTRKSCW